MSDNAVGIALIVPAILVVGLLIIVVVWKCLDIARDRARSRVGSEHPALVEIRQVIGGDLAELRRRVDAFESAALTGQLPQGQDQP